MVYWVYLVCSVCSVYLVEQDKLDELNKPDRAKKRLPVHLFSPALRF